MRMRKAVLYADGRWPYAVFGRCRCGCALALVRRWLRHTRIRQIPVCLQRPLRGLRHNGYLPTVPDSSPTFRGQRWFLRSPPKNGMVGGYRLCRRAERSEARRNAPAPKASGWVSEANCEAAARPRDTSVSAKYCVWRSHLRSDSFTPRRRWRRSRRTGR